MAGKVLVIQIPCFNEGDTLGITLAALPRHVPGFARVDWMVIDDGSTDRTIAVAKAAGVEHIVRLGRNQGLARAFAAGIEAALRAGADVIVNTDADNQYCADDIPKLTAPILAGEADLVIGSRPIADTPHFSRTKKALQLVGSMVVRMASRTQVVDAPSGFRAFSRAAAQRLHVHGDYTYSRRSSPPVRAGWRSRRCRSEPIRICGPRAWSRACPTMSCARRSRSCAASPPTSRCVSFAESGSCCSRPVARSACATCTSRRRAKATATSSR